MSRVLIFTGPKASGKTLLAVNFAIAAGKIGYSTALLATGPIHSNAASYTGVSPVHNLNDLAWGYCSARDVFVPCGENVELIVAGEPIGWCDGERERRLVSVAAMIEEKDFFVVDAMGEILEVDIPILPWVSEIFVVVTPEQVAAGEALWFIHSLCNRAPGKQINVILNRARVLETAETICCRLEHDFETILHLPLVCVGIVAEDVSSSADASTSLVFPRRPLSVLEIMERLVPSAFGSPDNRDVQPCPGDFFKNLFRCVGMEVESCSTAAIPDIAWDANAELTEQEVAEFMI